MRIAWESKGAGEPVLLIHGLGYARWGWEPVAEPLAQRFRLLLFDNRGMGESEIPPGPYTARAMAEDAVSVLDEAGVGRAHVVGTSLGGMVAQELALGWPDRVDRLVLACTTPGGADAYPLPERTLALIAEAPTLPQDVALRRFVENALAPGAPQELIDRIAVHRLASPPDPAGWAAQAAAGASFDAFGRLVPGDRLATLTGNSPAHVEVFFACAKAGLILLPLNWRLARPELEFQLEDAAPKLLLVEEGQEAVGAVPARPIEAVPPASEFEPVAEDGDPLLLIYTSGTTGRPKGALLTHANCFWTNVGFDLATGVGGSDVVLQTLPQFHVGSWNVLPLLAWWKGGTVVLERAFDAARVLQVIDEAGVTTMMGVPATYLFLSQEAGFASADLSTLRLAVVGGAPMPEALLETWRRRGVPIVQGYG